MAFFGFSRRQPSGRSIFQAGSTYVDAAVPTGAINGINNVYTITQAPSPVDSIRVFVNGVLQLKGTDYTLATTTITFVTAPPVSAALTVWYRF
jgi:hypothetical protein